MNEVEELLRGAVCIPDYRPIWEWAAEHIDFGNAEAFKGRYDVANVPWTKDFLRAIGDPLVREVTFIAPPQESGKTKAAEVAIAHRIVTRPAKMAFNTTTNVKAEAWSETRWDPMLVACPSIGPKLHANKHKKKRQRIVFGDGTYLLIQGAEVDANRASDSVEFQVNDEGFLWDRPWLSEMHGRTKAYRETRKIINISVGGRKGGELHERFLEGTQLEWNHRCPRCKKPFAYVFDRKRPECNIRFDVNAAVLHADGRLDLREFEKTVFVNCPDKLCGWQTPYDRDLLAELNRSAVYVPMNPTANPEHVSLHVNAFALGRRPWFEILRPWVRLHIRGGVFDPEVLKEFIIYELAEFWDERPYVVSSEIKTAAWLRQDVLKRGAWKDEILRVMTVDNQRGRRGDVPHRWFTCVAFAASGRARLVDAGRINEWDDVRKKQIELEVPDSTELAPGPWVAVDRRYDPTEVDEICSRWRWYGFLGTDNDEFPHPLDSPFAGSRQLFSEARAIDIGFGTVQTGRRYAMYHLWASQKVQDVFAAMRNNGLTEFPADIGTFCPEMAEQINSHKQFMEPQRKGDEKRVWKRIGDTPDHLYDCLCEAVVIALMAAIYKR